MFSGYNHWTYITPLSEQHVFSQSLARRLTSEKENHSASDDSDIFSLSVSQNYPNVILNTSFNPVNGTWHQKHSTETFGQTCRSSASAGACPEEVRLLKDSSARK